MRVEQRHLVVTLPNGVAVHPLHGPYEADLRAVEGLCKVVTGGTWSVQVGYQGKLAEEAKA